jgi:RNA polymerase sigma-70 factor (ECF subfamily)
VLLVAETEPRAPSDDDLIRRCQQREDREAFLELYERYKGRIYSFALTLLRNPADAEDAAQETFRYIFTKRHAYQPQGKFKSFIFKIAHSISIDIIRKRGRQAPLPASFEMGFEPAEPERAREVERLRACYGRLPRIYREIMAMRVADELSYEEIGEVLGVPIGTVKSRIHHAVELLREMLRSVQEGAGLARWDADAPEDGEVKGGEKP